MMDHQLFCPICGDAHLEFEDIRTTFEMGICVSFMVGCEACYHHFEGAVWGDNTGMWVEDLLLRRCPGPEDCQVHAFPAEADGEGE